MSDEVSKEFLNRFKTDADISKFRKQLYVPGIGKMYKGKTDSRLGYEKNAVVENNTGNSRMAENPNRTWRGCHSHYYKQPKTGRPEMAEPTFGSGLSLRLSGRYSL